MSREKEKEEFANDDHLLCGDDWCDSCQQLGSHFKCWDTDLDLADINPHIALHDAAFRVTGERAA